MNKRIYTESYDGGVRRAENPDKPAILAFLKRQEYVAVAAGRFTDVVTGETVDAAFFGFNQDGFSWSSQDVYHFEKYDLELTPEFCAYALAG